MKGYAVVLVGALLYTSGCGDSTPVLQTYSDRRFESTEWQSVFEAAEATMHEYFRVEHADPRTGLIRSVPVEDRAEAEHRLLGEAISTPRPLRRIAELRVEDRGDSVVARCSVLKQRYDAAEQTSHIKHSTIHDMPNRTPLEESQGMTRDDQRAWRTVGNDRRLEREMLAAIAERLASSRAPE